MTGLNFGKGRHFRAGNADSKAVKIQVPRGGTHCGKGVDVRTRVALVSVAAEMVGAQGVEQDEHHPLQLAAAVAPAPAARRASQHDRQGDGERAAHAGNVTARRGDRPRVPPLREPPPGAGV